MEYKELTRFEKINIVRNTSSVDISVWCQTFNHVEYIEDALKGFLAQKGDIVFEVIVFDDASNDGTSDIIKKYASLYPDIIKALIAEKNTYRTKGRHEMIKDLRMKYLCGKYVAYCEGDDYWIDNYKLLRQFRYMERHPDCSLYLHNFIRNNCKTGEVTSGNPFEVINSKRVSNEDLIMLYNGHLPTASFFFRKSMFEMPEMFRVAPGSDYSRVLFLMIKGYVYYDSRIMSVYRFFSSGSTTSRLSENIGERLRFDIGMIIFLSRFLNNYSNTFDVWICNRIQNYLNAVAGYAEITDIDFLDEFKLNEEQKDEWKIRFSDIRKMGALLKNKFYISDMVREYCSNRKHIIIMGTGDYAKLLSTQLDNNHIEYEGFAISDPRTVQAEFNGKPVWCLSNLPFRRKDTGVLVAINPVRWDDLKTSLKRARIVDYYCPYLFEICKGNDE